MSHWEQATFPHSLLPKLGALNIVGLTIKGYGCPVQTTPACVARARPYCTPCGIPFLSMLWSCGPGTYAAVGDRPEKRCMRG